MFGKTQTAKQPSIDELLTSIRQAIHERVEPAAPAAPSPTPRLVHTTPADPSDSARTGPLAGAGQEGFAGLLGGDVRLEEALARLHQTGWRRDPKPLDAPVAARIAAAPASATQDEPRLRPTIAAWSGGVASPVAPAGSAKARSSPARPAPVRQAVRPEPAPAPRKSEPLYSPAPAAYQPPAGGWNDDFRGDDPLYDAAPDVSTSASERASDLLSSEAARAANSAFGRLADAIAVHAAESERTLDEITQDCLRPLLKGWLDENLPSLVERLVRDEIARLARPDRQDAIRR